MKSVSFRKFSFEQRDLDDADEDGNTVYRGLATPVDIRQVVEVERHIVSLHRWMRLFLLSDIRWL